MRDAILLLLILGACKSSKKPEQAPPAPAAVPAPPPAIKCSRAVTDAIKAKYFPGLTMLTADDPVAGPDGPITSCHYRNDKLLVRIDISCGDTFTHVDSYLSSLEAQTTAKYDRVSGVGRGAFAKTKPGDSEFGLVHTTLPCLIDVEGIADDPANVFDPKPLALDVAAALGK